MKKIKDITIIEYKYDTEDERIEHIEKMESIGFECDGQVKKADISYTGDKINESWFARFYKYN